MSGKAILTCRPNSHLFQERTLILDAPVKIGRSVARARPSSNNAIFDCKVLSRNHALIWYNNNNGKFFLQDTKSSNGTFINNQRLSRSGEESAPREICSGDTVQFGVDVIENTRKVTHGCIIANLKLYFPDGKEAKPSHSATSVSSNSIPVEDLYELNQYLQEASQREHMLETKLFALQEVLNSIKDSVDSGWRALITEDRLLSRVEALENQLQVYSKSHGEDKLKEELVKLLDEKNQYQCTAKEFLKKVLDEKLEAIQKCQEMKRTLVNVEASYSNLTDEMGQSQANVKDLAHKLSLQLVKNEDIEMQLQELEAAHEQVVERLESRNMELEEMLALRSATEESLGKQLTELSLVENVVNEKGLDSLQYPEKIDDSSFRSIKREENEILAHLFEENKDEEVRELLSAQLDLLPAEQRAKMPQYFEDKRTIEEDSLITQTLRLVPLNETANELDENLIEVKGMLKNGVNIESIDSNDSFIKNIKAEDSDSKDSDESGDLSDSVVSKVSLETMKLDRSKQSDNSVQSLEKSDKTLKHNEENIVISQVLKEQNKLLSQFKIENFEPIDTFQNNQNKKNQEQDENLLKRQLLEAQQSAKLSRNEQAQLMDMIIALTAELESKNLSNDNKIREKLLETQQERNKLQNTLSTLQSEILGLREKNKILEEEAHLLQLKIDNFQFEKSMERNNSVSEQEDLTAKVSKLREELLLVSSKYMVCNEERSKITKELENLKLDYRAISHQPYFNLIFALPCIVLILAIMMAFYPTLSHIMGTAERADDQQEP